MKELTEKIYENKEKLPSFLIKAVDKIPFKIRPQELVVFISDETEKYSLGFFLITNRENGNKMEASACSLEKLLETLDIKFNKPVYFFLGNSSADLNALERSATRTLIQAPFLERGNFATLAISVSGEDIEKAEGELFAVCLASELLGAKAKEIIRKNDNISEEVKNWEHPFSEYLFEE